MNQDKNLNRRDSARMLLLADVDLEVDAEVITAMTVDISETGVKIETWPPLIVTLRFVADGKLQDRKAQLVWSNKTPEGGMSYGFNYLPDSEENEK